MTDECRTAELVKARRELAKAQAAWHQHKALGMVKLARHYAGQIEFWGNKVAFLTCVRA